MARNWKPIRHSLSAYSAPGRGQRITPIVVCSVYLDSTPLLRSFLQTSAWTG